MSLENLLIELYHKNVDVIIENVEDKVKVTLIDSSKQERIGFSINISPEKAMATIIRRMVDQNNMNTKVSDDRLSIL